MCTEAGSGQFSPWLHTQRQHTVSSSVARQECDHPAHSTGQTSLSSHGHQAQILFITRPPTGQRAGPRNERRLTGLVSQCCMAVCHSTTTDKQQTATLSYLLTHLLFLGFLILPVEFHFVHQMRGILGTILKRRGIKGLKVVYLTHSFGDMDYNPNPWTRINHNICH